MMMASIYSRQAARFSRNCLRPACSAAAALAGLIAALGCRPGEQIQTYTVPKETASRAIATTLPQPGEPTDRMLAAILPDGDKAWFLKVVGPLADLDGHTNEIAEFFMSVRLAAEQPHPNWQLPDGWKEQAGSGMRAATIVIPSGGKPLELTVTSLPWSGGPGDLLSNVNRWRGQMQLAPIGVPGLADCTRNMDAGGTTMTVVDLRGRMQDTGMSPPFAGGRLGPAQPAAPIGRVDMPTRPAGETAAASGDAAKLPAGHPPLSTQPDVSAESPLKFELPADWQSLPATGFRKAAFRIAAETGVAEVTVIDFSADAPPAMSDPLANVNRWRAEVGLEPLMEENLSDSTESIEVDGSPATYVEAIPDPAKPSESKSDRATAAAMVKHGSRLWFFKMTGDRAVVAAQRDQFKTFLKSVRFKPDGKAADGN